MSIINEKLFEQLIRAPHAVRREMVKADFGVEQEGPAEDHGPGFKHGNAPMGHHRHGNGMKHGHGPGGFRGQGSGPGHFRKRNPAFGRERLLDAIGSHEGGVRQKTLTQEFRMNPSSVSELISKLENDRYVKRTVDPTDKRATLITLTELGEAKVAELSDERNERLDKAFSVLTDDEKDQLITLLEKLTAEK